jgi:adenylate cyclase
MSLMRGKGRRLLPSEIYVSALLSLVVIPSFIYLCPYPFEALDARIFDYKLRLRGPVEISPAIAHLDIDDKSVKKFGLWPWDRALSAQIVTRLQRLGARTIVFDIFYPSKGKSPEGDEAFFEAIARSRRVVSGTALGVTLSGDPDENVAVEDEKKGEQLYDKAWPIAVPAGLRFWRVNELRDSFVPLVPIIQASKEVGHIVSTADRDGVHRRLPLLVRYADRCVPSLSLAAFVAYCKADPKSISISRGGSISIARSNGSLSIPIDSHGNMLVNWPDEKQCFPHFSAAALLEDSDPAMLEPLFKDKVVFVAYTATGATDMGINPFFSDFLLSRIHSCALNTLLTGRFIRAVNAFPLAVPAAGLASLLFSFACLRMRYRYAIALEIAVAVGFVVLAFLCLRLFSYEIPTSGPLLLFVTTATTFLVTRTISMESRVDRISHAMERYLSPQMLASVAELSHEIDLSTKRKELTILFVDIKGFSAISESVDVEYLQAFLNDFLERMTRAVFDHGGTIDKFLGDGLLAFFGDPLELENHAVAAIKAAEQMHREMEDLNEKWSGAGIPELAEGVEIRVGVNTGMVVVGNIGSERRMEYTVLGSAVNVASRLQEAAHPGKTLISARTFFLARDHVQCTGPRAIRVKGMDREIKVYEIESVSGGTGVPPVHE